MKIDKTPKGNLAIMEDNNDYLFIIGSTPFISTDATNKDVIVLDHVTTTRGARQVVVNVKEVKSLFGKAFSGSRNDLMKQLAENFI